MNYTYILINAFLLLIPSVLFFLLKTELEGKGIWKFIFPAVFITMFVFSVPTEYLTQVRAIVFNPPFLTDHYLWHLPVEELLFSLLMPLTGLAIYMFLNARFPGNSLEKYSLAWSNILLGIFIAIIYFGYHHQYTLITFVLLFLFMLYVEYVNKIRFMYRFYRAFLVSLIPFYAAMILVNTLPIIQYTEEETLIFSLFNVPFESPFYFMGMLLLTVYLFELFKSRSLK